MFVRNDSNTFEFDIENDETGPECAEAEDYGFVLAETLTAASCPSDTCNYNDVARDVTKDYHAIFCPFREEDGDYYYTRHKFKTTAYRDFAAVMLASSVATPTQEIVLPNTPALNCRLVTVTPSVTPNYSFVLSLTAGGTATYGIYDASDTTCTGAQISSLSFASGTAAPQQYRVKSTTLGTINISYAASTDPVAAQGSIIAGSYSMSSGYLFCVQNPPGGSCGASGNVGLTLASGGAVVANETGRTLNFGFSLTGLLPSACSSFNVNNIGPGLTLRQFKASTASGAESLISSDPDVAVNPGCQTVAW